MDKRKEQFLKVLEKNKGIVFKVCNSYCKNPEDRKDLVQDVIIQLWNSFDKYDDRYKISTWMYRIALNVAISYYRKSSTRNKYTTSIDIEFIQIADEEKNEKEEDLKLLENFISQLDELNKALIILYLDGNSHNEIGNILNLSKSNVGTKINRIKQNLKEQFKKLDNNGIR